MDNKKLLNLMKLLDNLIEQGAKIESFDFDRRHIHQSVYLSKTDFIRIHKGKAVTVSEIGIMSYNHKIDEDYISVQCFTSIPKRKEITVTLGDEYE